MSSLSSLAPGRIELLGNHTDYNQGLVLSCAISHGIHARGCSRDDGQIILRSRDTEGVRHTSVDAPWERRSDWTDYPMGVFHCLKEDGADLCGFEIEFESDLPIGAGLSSSAAIEVSTALFLMKLSDFSLTPIELARLCRRAENVFVGVQCGILDQISSIFGKRDHALFLDSRSETVERIPFPKGHLLLVIHSGAPHALTGGEYNERREQCFEAASRLGIASLRDTSSAQLQAANLPDLLFRRALHVVGETERVREAIDHLRSGQIASFGRLMTASHRSSMENFENSTPELDILVEIACSLPEVFGARLTGGGFGGAIIALVRKPDGEKVGQQIAQAYQTQTGYIPRVYPCPIGDGALTF